MATTPLYSKQIPLKPQEMGTASYETRKNTWATNETSVKVLNSDDSVEKLVTPADRVGGLPLKNYTTLGILDREPNSSGLVVLYRIRSLSGKNKPLTKRNTTI